MKTQGNINLKLWAYVDDIKTMNKKINNTCSYKTSYINGEKNESILNELKWITNWWKKYKKSNTIYTHGYLIFICDSQTVEYNIKNSLKKLI